jgi:hypothetical protein
MFAPFALATLGLGAFAPSSLGLGPFAHTLPTLPIRVEGNPITFFVTV